MATTPPDTTVAVEEVQLPTYPATSEPHPAPAGGQSNGRRLRSAAAATLRLEQELASSKQGIAAQQEAAKREEAMKRVRKERMWPLFSPEVRGRGPSGQEPCQDTDPDRTDGRAIERPKTPTRDRAKTPTKPEAARRRAPGGPAAGTTTTRGGTPSRGRSRRRALAKPRRRMPTPRGRKGASRS